MCVEIHTCVISGYSELQCYTPTVYSVQLQICHWCRKEDQTNVDHFSFCSSLFVCSGASKHYTSCSILFLNIYTSSQCQGEKYV